MLSDHKPISFSTSLPCLSDSTTEAITLSRSGLLAYQNAVKSAKATYSSVLIMANHFRPKVLFSVINYVVNHPVNTMSAASDALCESFLRFFLMTKSLIYDPK